MEELSAAARDIVMIAPRSGAQGANGAAGVSASIVGVDRNVDETRGAAPQM